MTVGVMGSACPVVTVLQTLPRLLLSIELRRLPKLPTNCSAENRYRPCIWR